MVVVGSSMGSCSGGVYYRRVILWEIDKKDLLYDKWFRKGEKSFIYVDTGIV